MRGYRGVQHSAGIEHDIDGVPTTFKWDVEGKYPESIEGMGFLSSRDRNDISGLNAAALKKYHAGMLLAMQGEDPVGYAQVQRIAFSQLHNVLGHFRDEEAERFPRTYAPHGNVLNIERFVATQAFSPEKLSGAAIREIQRTLIGTVVDAGEEAHDIEAVVRLITPDTNPEFFTDLGFIPMRWAPGSYDLSESAAPVTKGKKGTVYGRDFR